MDDDFIDAVDQYMDENYTHIKEDIYHDNECIFTVDWDSIKFERGGYDSGGFSLYKKVTRFKYRFIGVKYETEHTTCLAELVSDIACSIADYLEDGCSDVFLNQYVHGILVLQLKLKSDTVDGLIKKHLEPKAEKRKS